MKHIYFFISLFLTSLSSFSQTTNPAPYCASQFQSNYNMVSSMVFNGTSFNGFGAVPLWSTGMTFNTYKYFNATVLNSVNRGQMFSMSINFPPVEDGEPRYFVVWIDFNKNNTFEDSERVMYNSNTINAFLPIAIPGSTTVLVTKDIQVPANAQIGTTRMRIMRGQNDANLGVYDPAFTISEPCRSSTDFGYGCVYDFNVVINSGLGIEDTTKNNFSVYPNPASQFVTIDHHLTGALAYSISSLTGMTVKRNQVGTDNTIDLAGLSAGVYLLELYADGMFVGRKKIMKQ